MGKTFFEQLDAHTKGLTAEALLDQGKIIGRIVFRAPKAGEGRLYAYVQVWGTVGAYARGSATGYGYDKRTSAVISALGKIGQIKTAKTDYQQDIIDRLYNASKHDDKRYDEALRLTGFTTQYII